MTHMADFIKPEKIPEITPQETKEPVQADQSPEQKEKETEIVEFPKAQQEKNVEPQQTPEQTGEVVPLSERIAEEKPATKTERQQEIEKMLSEDLEDIYKKLNSDQQEKVKIEGEEAAEEIEKLVEEMIQTGKDASKQVLKEIRDWMHKIPGVNKYFLEQESKRKSDHMLALAKKSQETSGKTVAFPSQEAQAVQPEGKQYKKAM